MRARWVCAILAAFVIPAHAESNPFGLSFVESKDAKLIYFNRLEFLVPHALQTFTNSLELQKRLYRWNPSEPVTLLLMDSADYGNAAVTAFPHSRMFFQVSPESHAFETSAATERFYSTMNHELVHVVQGDIESSQDKAMRSFFLGKVAPQSENPETLLYNYLTVPRFAAPRWYIEGSAVFMETWMNGGLGRAQGGYDEMVFRAMVRDGATFYDPLGLVSKGIRSDFQVGANAYLYGTRFMTWLAYRFNPESVIAWVRRDEGSKRYYSDQFEHVFGLPLDSAWQQWITFEHEYQRQNLAEVRKFPITQHKPVIGNAIGSISRMFFDETTSQIIAGFRYPGTLDYVAALSTKNGTIRNLAEIKRAMLYRVTSLALDKTGRTAFFTNDNIKHRDLMSVNIDTGESKMLIEDARIGEMVVNPIDKSLIGVRHDRGIATLVRIPFPYEEWEKVHEFAYEHVPYDLDISPDGKLLSASVGELSGDQFVRVWELAKVLEGNMKPISEFKFGQSVPESFVFSADSRYLYGSSYYTGVSNIFRYEVANGDVVAMSNAEAGFFRPVPLADGRLMVLTYTGAGFVPVTIDAKPITDVSAIKFLGAEVVNKHPIVKNWQVPPANAIDAEKLIIGRGFFDPTTSMSIESAYPILQGYKETVGLGYHFNFADTLGFARLGLTMAVTPNAKLPSNERSHIQLKGEYKGWRGSVALNRSDFYDLFGPTKRSRKGKELRLGYDDLLIYDDPRLLTLKYDAEILDDIDTLPEAQNVGAGFKRLISTEVGLYYSNLRRSLGAVNDETGNTASVSVAATRVGTSTVPSIVAEAAFGYPLPLPHTSIWLRGAIGLTNGDPINSVANFYFGAFGNNYVDNREIKRYHRYSSMPGFDLDQISAQRFAKTTLELNLPPYLFENVGLPVAHATWLRPSIFASTLWADPDRSSSQRQRFTSLGLQTDMRISVLHWSNVTLSAGFAVGLIGGRRVSNEVMISLKIL
jgi:hypothetical protein